MKSLTIVVLLALTSILGQAQNTNMAMATYAIKGPIRTFRIEVATFVAKDDGTYVEGPRLLRSEASFNEDGNRTDLRFYNERGSLTRRIEMKFNGRKMIESINSDGAGRMVLRTEYFHDDQGRSNGSMSYNGDGSLNSKWVIKRNNRGLVTESARYSGQGTLMEQNTSRYDGPTLLTQQREVYYPNGSLQLRMIYVPETKRSETITYRQDGSVLNKSFRENWDIAQYSPDGSLQKATAISGEHRLLDEVTLGKDGSAKTREAERPDQIDAHGNWTKQTKWLTDAKGTRPLKVTYREITYY
jgi:antitoxin component YwqK of YwqJK toxin-antitoxin module